MFYKFLLRGDYYKRGGHDFMRFSGLLKWGHLFLLLDGLALLWNLGI
ncbi:hypothetical protein D3OALGA1CA_1675 [Olavius algarvensis associated proteobacterium Delta 3]|nr:hypothetical protein D3OALGA1CA_1675 [Olavius algarvensis associated proteobacterium Delta 3]